MDKLNMSLEDVIKSGKKNQKTAPRRPLPRNQLPTMQKVPFYLSYSNSKNKHQRREKIKDSPLKSAQSRKIGKQQQQQQLPMQRKFAQLLPRKSQYRRKRELMQRPMQQRKQKRVIQQNVPVRANSGKRLLKVSGIQPNLTNQELFDLFSTIGPLKRCNINYDQLGQSKMTAIVGFEQAVDARRAIQEYNGAQLDDKILRIQYVGGNIGNRRRSNSGSQMKQGGQYQQQKKMRTFRQRKMNRQLKY